MSIGERIKKRRQELNLSVEDVAKVLNKNRATVYRYESDEIENMPTSVLEPLSKILNTTPAYLMGWEDENSDPILENIPGIITPVKLKKIPILGTIACGNPILAEENYDGYFMIDENLPYSDFVLRAKGDSMIDANIHDGDLVFFKKQNDVDNGTIAAVLIDEEATLKRVNKSNDTLILQPCNTNYNPIIINKSDNKKVLILGQMVGVYSKRSK